MKTLSECRVCVWLMLLLGGALLSPAVFARGEDAEASANSATEFPRAGTVTAETLNVRARPGLFYEVVAKLMEEDKMKVLEQQGEWYRIPIPEDAEAWVAERFVSDNHQITGDGVRVRAGTGVAFSAYHTLDQGTSVKPTGETRDGWVRIIPPPDATAWINAQFVELAPPKVDAAAKDEPEEGPKAETEAETEADVTDDIEAATREAENRDAADVASEDEAVADEGGDQDEEIVEETDEHDEHDAEDSAAEVEAESGNADRKGAVVDLREQDRSGQSSSESRDVKMLPPIYLPENETAADVDEDVRTTKPLDTPRRPKTPERKADSTLVYTKVTPDEEEDGGADVDVDSKTPPKGAETEKRLSKPEKDKAQRLGKEHKKAEADKAEAPTVFRVSGTVVSLGDRANEAASHVVVRSTSGRMVPVAYLRSQNVDLAEWEGRKLHVYGKRIPCDWSKPLVAVSGVLIAR